MKTLGYVCAFLCGSITGVALGLLLAPEKGIDARSKIPDAVDDFCKKHDIKLSRKEAEDSVEDIKDVASNAIQITKDVLKRQERRNNSTTRRGAKALYRASAKVHEARCN